jgi:Na+-transporting methylmalonyl-CoA/oxaloacetate decarboxylase gamma subunit
MKMPFLFISVLIFLFTCMSAAVAQDSAVISLGKADFPVEARATGLCGNVGVVGHADEKSRLISVEDPIGPDWVCPQVQRQTWQRFPPPR